MRKPSGGERMERGLIAYYDVGTSNVRIFLLDGEKRLLCTRRRTLGAKDAAIAGSNRPLLEGMKALYDEALAETGWTDGEVEAIYASGMATSPYGIFEIPHYPAPVTAEEFARRGVTPYWESTVFGREIYLISGLKTVGTDVSSTNNTRGEEIEVLGVLPELAARYPGRQTAVILPGSHTHVLLAGQGRLTGILSTFTGELFYALKQDTILAPVLSVESDRPNPVAVALGLENLRRYGFNRALYIGHAMRVFERESPHFRRCYCEAVVSGGVIEALDAYCEERWTECDTAVVVANPYMAELFTLLLAGSRRIRSHSTLTADGERSYALEGLRGILNIREGTK